MDNKLIYTAINFVLLSITAISVIILGIPIVNLHFQIAFRMASESFFTMIAGAILSIPLIYSICKNNECYKSAEKLNDDNEATVRKIQQQNEPNYERNGNNIVLITKSKKQLTLNNGLMVACLVCYLLSTLCNIATILYKGIIDEKNLSEQSSSKEEVKEAVNWSLVAFSVFCTLLGLLGYFISHNYTASIIRKCIKSLENEKGMHIDKLFQIIRLEEAQIDALRDLFQQQRLVANNP